MHSVALQRLPEPANPVLATLHRPTPGMFRSRIPVRRVSAPDRAPADLTRTRNSISGCRVHFRNFIPRYEGLPHIVSSSLLKEAPIAFELIPTSTQYCLGSAQLAGIRPSVRLKIHVAWNTAMTNDHVLDWIACRDSQNLSNTQEDVGIKKKK